MADNEISYNLRNLAKNLEPQYLQPAMAKACAVVRNDAVNNAPQGTGALKRSIDFEVSEDGTEGVVFSNLEYAPYVEVGTGIYSTKGNGRDTPWRYQTKDGWFTTKGQKAQPYLEPALQQNTSKIKQCFQGMF